RWCRAWCEALAALCRIPVNCLSPSLRLTPSRSPRFTDEGQGRPPGWCSRFHGEGYQEGYEEGNSLGIIEGRQYGTLHGAKIGSEIGCYQGFAFAWRCLLHTCTTEKDSKKMKALESLIEMIQKFPYDDPTYDKLHEDLDKIRGKFKQLCSLLNVQPDFKISAEGSGLSF
uniref:LTO1 maturation factor of ABCE1 n=2 Tax=Canis lupus familiaris TaxID=9615 RepID=A0A8P0TK27_CANLF